MDKVPQVIRALISLACLVGAMVIPFGTGTANAAPDSIIFTDGPGTSSPPSSLGPYTMTPFAADTQATGASVAGVAGPTGTLGFSPSLEHCLTPNADGCWQTWSNGYSGDVYAATSGSVTLTLPPGTDAFYFYAEPAQFMTFSMTATSDNGTSSGAIPVAGSSGAQYFGFYTTASDALKTITVSGEDPDGFAVGEFGISSCGYASPPKWNTEEVASFTPGSEPLNVIISGCSDVPVNTIINHLNGWGTVLSGPCLSTERADVTGSTYVNQQHAWRLEASGAGLATCAEGNYLSLSGNEDHARLWNQPVKGSKYGAWFITASYETACIQIGDDMKPLSLHRADFWKFWKQWHCIDGSKNADGTSSSFGSDGYNHGASKLVADIQASAEPAGWTVTVQTATRPAGVGEGGVPFSNVVYVVTVDRQSAN